MHILSAFILICTLAVLSSCDSTEPIVVKKDIYIYFHVRDAATKAPLKGVSIKGPSFSFWTGITNDSGNAYYDAGSLGDISFTISATNYITIDRHFDDVGTSTPVYDTIDLVNPHSFLVASYYFSNNFVDSTGNGHDGTNHGTSWTTDRFGTPNSAIDCDGNTDYISVEDAPKLNFGKSDFTICVWVNTSAEQNSSNTCFIIDKSTLVSSIFTGYQVAYVSGSIRQAKFGTTYGSTYIQSSNIGGSNLWHHYAVVVERSGAISVYYDGKLVDFDKDFNEELAGNINTTAQLLFGGNGTAINAFKGKIDDIKLYNAALDEKSILDLYHENGW